METGDCALLNINAMRAISVKSYFKDLANLSVSPMKCSVNV